MRVFFLVTMKVALTYSVLLLSHMQLLGQTFNTVYVLPGSQQAFSAKEHPDGGFMIAGYSKSNMADPAQICLMKIDAEGLLIWRRSYPTPTAALATSVYVLPDGSTIMGGAPWSTLPDSLHLLRTDEDGNVLWHKRYQFNDGSTNVQDVRPTADGGFIFCGRNTIYQPPATFLVDIVIGKVNSAGDLEWHRTIDLGGIESGGRIVEHPSGDFIVGGSSRSNGIPEILLMKMSIQGDTIWTRRSRPLSVESEFADMDLTLDGGIIVTGRAWQQQFEIMLCRYNENGEVAWARTWPTPDSTEVGSGVRQVADGGFIIGGTGGPINDPGSSRYRIMSTDGLGELNWVKFYEIPGPSPIVTDLSLTNDNGFLTIGYIGPNGFDGPSNIFALKTDEHGSSVGINGCPSLSDEFQILPNPTAGQFWIRTPASSIGIKGVQICDATGSVIQELDEAEWGNNGSSTALLQNGIYLVRVSYANGSFVQQRLVVTK